MATKIQLKRGLEKDIPILNVGEPAFTTDTWKLFIGSPNGNKQVFGGGGNVVPNTQSWVSTNNQDTFTLTNGHISTDKSIIVFVGGIIQPNITLLNNTTFKLPEPLVADENVYAIWFEVSSGSVPNQSEIDITLLKNYQEDVATPIANLSKGVSEYEWTATDGQLTYVLPSGQSYDTNSKWLEVFVGGAPIPDSQIQKDNSSQFTLLIDSSKVKVGMNVFAIWTQSYIPATSGHNVTHQLGGIDEIDITKLKNFNEQVANPLAEKASQADLQTTDTTAKDAQTKANSPLNQIPQNGITKDKIALGTLTQNELSDEFKQQIAGTTPINAVPADGGVSLSKLGSDVPLDKYPLQPYATQKDTTGIFRHQH
jgi:hypothetical protein